LRTFLSDPESGEDVGRYNHRAGDLVLHPEGLLHWPGRLRPPYEPFDFPPGMRRCGLSLVYCASIPTRRASSLPSATVGPSEDMKSYVTPAPPMAMASTRGHAGVLARIGRTSLALLELPQEISPPHGGWVVVLEAEAGSEHAACDLVRVPEGVTLDGAGILRALLLTSDAKSPDPTPPAWREVPPPPFAPFEEREAEPLPLELGGIRIDAISPSFVSVAIRGAKSEVPRYWLARMLHRVAMHGFRLGYAETYGGFFVDDREGEIRFGLRGPKGSVASHVALSRADAGAAIERMYRAVAPIGYRERAS
jgi:hypothetical protein